ncbi:MAG: PRC-barrel domain-containing protein [Nanoarchaeota archaeon]
MKYIIIIIVFFSIIPLVFAETTFFDQDDDFIMGNSPATDSGATGQVTGGGGCRYEWNCTNWSECLQSGKQIRNCTNIGTCSDAYKSPEIEQNCTFIAPEVEKDTPTKKNNTKKDDLTDNKTPDYSSEETTNNRNYFLVFLTILIFGCCFIFLKYKEKIKSLVLKLEKKCELKNNSIKGLINKEVYTDEGVFIGNIKEAVLEKNKIHSIKIELDKRHKFKMRGIILEYSLVKAIGNIVIIDNEVIESIEKKN